MKFTNKTNLPAPVFNALTADNYSRGASNRSVTQLMDSPRVRILKAEHDDDIVEDVSDRVWSVLGTAVHNIFEDATDHEDKMFIAEQRLFYDVDGWTISGAMDLQEEDSKTGAIVLSDYKCTSVWSVIYDKVEWHNQLNFYAWLARKASHVAVSKLQIVAVLRDWKKKEAMTKGKDYPQAPLVIVPIPLWSNDKQDEYVEGRIKIHSEAEFDRMTGEPLPLCTPSERWMKPTTYAVKKTANKRAIRVFDSEEEAKTYFLDKGLDSKHSIETRKGEPTRCFDYCSAAPFCDQFQGEVWS